MEKYGGEQWGHSFENTSGIDEQNSTKCVVKVIHNFEYRTFNCEPRKMGQFRDNEGDKL